MFEKHIYSNRRNALKKQISKGIALFLGNQESAMNYPANTYHFRQDSTFLYFFGLNDPDMAAVIDFESGEEIIFGNDVDIDDIIWMGPQPAVAHKAALCGVSMTKPFNDLFTYFEKNKGRFVHFLPPYRGKTAILLEKLTGVKPDEQKKNASAEFIKAVVALRSVKDDVEIEAIEKAMEVGWLMHTTGLKMAREGVYEREIAGAMEGVALAHGCVVSFPVILTKNGQTLHNHYHGNRLEKGNLVLVDAGIESSEHYCTDHTRTYPVGGTFTSKQKDIYSIVLKSQKEAIDMIKPGIRYRDVHLHSALVIAEGLKALGLMTGDMKEAVALGAHAMFFPHGLGHMMGMDVHDMEDLGENYVGYDENTTRSTLFGTAYLRLGKELRERYVLTVEPGLYFIPALIEKWKNENMFPQFINYTKAMEYLDFGGIRIEDDVLVTPGGSKVFGKPIPKEVDEIERLLK